MANLSIEEIIRQVETICRYRQVGHLYLFGSYATGEQTAASDIDFVVKGCQDISGLRIEVEQIPTLKKIDIFDYDGCKNKFLKEDMDRYGKQIY